MASLPPRIQPPPQQPGESLRAANARIAAANRVIAAEEMRQRQAAMEARQQQPRGMGLPPGGMQMTGMEPPPRPEPMPPRPEPMGPGAMGALRGALGMPGAGPQRTQSAMNAQGLGSVGPRPAGGPNFGGMLGPRGASSVNTTTDADIMGRPRPMPPSSQINPQRPNVMGFPDEMMGPGARGVQMEPTGRAPRPVFKKGGPVKAKAPVKKKAGGMIAKPKAAAAAKPKGKAMPAFKKGGAVKGKR